MISLSGGLNPKAAVRKIKDVVPDISGTVIFYHTDFVYHSDICRSVSMGSNRRACWQEQEKKKKSILGPCLEAHEEKRRHEYETSHIILETAHIYVAFTKILQGTANFTLMIDLLCLFSLDALFSTPNFLVDFFFKKKAHKINIKTLITLSVNVI
ncbi:hypothetical protein ACJX0J_011632 [Zea mays]